jgi:hypothetical protein
MRKNAARKFLGFEKSAGEAWVPLDGVFLGDSERRKRNLVEWAARMSTGCAQEMQKCSFRVSRFEVTV